MRTLPLPGFLGLEHVAGSLAGFVVLIAITACRSQEQVSAMRSGEPSASGDFSGGAGSGSGGSSTGGTW